MPDFSSDFVYVGRIAMTGTIKSGAEHSSAGTRLIEAMLEVQALEFALRVLDVREQVRRRTKAALLSYSRVIEPNRRRCRWH
jgi:hypothetical protein